MGIKEKINVYSRRIFIGREIQFFDKLIFYLTKGNSSGWLLGNKIVSWLYGKREFVSNEPVIFIGGFPRSGTTLLRAILERHKDIASPGSEVNVFQDIKEERILKEFGLNEKEIKKINSKDLILFVDKLLKLYKKKKKKKHVLLKQPKYVFLIKDTFKYFPKSKIIHIIRDGKEATMSQRYYLLPPWKKEWPYNWCCRQWVTYINQGKKFRKDKRYLEIKYEDLLKKPFETIQKITHFLGLSAMTKKQIENFHEKVDVKKHPDHPEVKKPINKKIIGKWTSKMNDKDKRIFKKIAGKTFEEIGYGY